MQTLQKDRASLKVLSGKDYFFKLTSTSVNGPTGVVKGKGPSPLMCGIVGHANEHRVRIGGSACFGLIDSGSMISAICQDFFQKHLESTHQLEDFSSLSLEGVGGFSIPYLGMVEVSCKIAGCDEVVVPLLVFPTNPYSRRVPAIIGMNVLKLLSYFPMVQNSGDDDEFGVYCSDPCILLARQTAVISARVGVSCLFLKVA